MAEEKGVLDELAKPSDIEERPVLPGRAGASLNRLEERLRAYQRGDIAKEGSTTYTDERIAKITKTLGELLSQPMDVEKIGQASKVVLAETAGAREETRLEYGLTTVGRDTENDFYLDSGNCSRIHALYLVLPAYKELPERAFILDIYSTNGTELNNGKIEPGKLIPLKGGNRIKFPGIIPEEVHFTPLTAAESHVKAPAKI